jgi:hypothetical protein
MEKTHMSRGMAGTVDHVEALVSDQNLISRLQPAIRREGAHRRESEHLALLRHPVDPELIVSMRPFDRQAKTFRQVGNPPYVIDVAMRDQNPFRHQPLTLHHLNNAIDIAPRIADSRPAGFRTPQYR